MKVEVEIRSDNKCRPKIIGTIETPPDRSSKTCARILLFLSWLLMILTTPFCLFFCMKLLPQYRRAVIFRLGRLISPRAKGPGVIIILPLVDTFVYVDMRISTYAVPSQEVLTKDAVSATVDAVIYYRVEDATLSVTNAEDFKECTHLLAKASLRNVIGTQTLHDILNDRVNITENMQQSMDIAAEDWGVKIERVEIKVVRVPVHLQRSMAAEAEATRQARAKVISAEGEQKASYALRAAAEVIGNNPAALHLRYLEALNSISVENKSTIVFPIPFDLLTNVVNPKKETPPQFIRRPPRD